MLIALTLMFKAFRGWLNEQDAEDERARQSAAHIERVYRQAAECYVHEHRLGPEQIEPLIAEVREGCEARMRREAEARRDNYVDEFSLICIMAAILRAQFDGSSDHYEDHGPVLSTHQAVTEAVEIVARVKDLRDGDTIHINVLPFKRRPKPAAVEGE